MNIEEKLILKERIKHILRESLFEIDKDVADNKSDGTEESDGGAKRKTVMQWLKDDKLDKATLAYELWPDKDEDSARSLFSKKLRGHDPEKKKYYFSEDEIIKLFNMIEGEFD